MLRETYQSSLTPNRTNLKIDLRFWICHRNQASCVRLRASPALWWHITDSTSPQAMCCLPFFPLCLTNGLVLPDSIIVLMWLKMELFDMNILAGTESSERILSVWLRNPVQSSVSLSTIGQLLRPRLQSFILPCTRSVVAMRKSASELYASWSACSDSLCATDFDTIRITR